MTPQTLWHQIVFDTMPQGKLKQALQKAVADLETLARQPFYIARLQVKLIPLTELGAYVEEPNLYAVAVFLHMSDDLPGWALPDHFAFQYDPGAVQQLTSQI